MGMVTNAFVIDVREVSFMITIKEIAQMLGMSTTTVSNVIHGKTKEVSQATIEKVEAALEEYNYIPNISARNLAQNESKIIGVAMRSRKDKYDDNALKDPFTGELIGGIEKALRHSGYYMMIYISEDVEELVQHISLWNADGLLLLGILGEEWRKIKERYKKPTVFIDSYFDKEIKDLVNVGLQDYQGTYELTKYLISCGHRKIAFMADNCVGVDSERFKGFCQALNEAGIIFDPKKDFLYHRPSRAERKQSYDEICNHCNDYTAVVCVSDYYAVSLINELEARGISVPDDISVAGFDDNYLSQKHRPAVTTVHQDPELKGELAVKQLIKMIKGKRIKEHSIMLPAEVMVRDSVKNLNK
ncbi:MAG: LacI family DNA-binding transcriptional regulator [Lachnospiraceae bacterium]|nr:LacI family DNA-binding transcriptional regulator [Lachnospiraceae bacterium]MDD3616100.1 LacI family DNA-binding transcriptional regulator [Lachnospiraceae bacterium]